MAAARTVDKVTVRFMAGLVDLIISHLTGVHTSYMHTLQKAQQRGKQPFQNFDPNRNIKGLLQSCDALRLYHNLRIDSQSPNLRYCCGGQYRHIVYAMATSPPPPPDRAIQVLHGEASEAAGADATNLKEAGNRAFAKGNLEEAYTVRHQLSCIVCMGLLLSIEKYMQTSTVVLL